MELEIKPDLKNQMQVFLAQLTKEEVPYHPMESGYTQKNTFRNILEKKTRNIYRNKEK
jgi:hypothetical protein